MVEPLPKVVPKPLWMAMARNIASDSNCHRRRYGAVVAYTDTNKICGTGANTAFDCPFCCRREERQIPHGTRYEECTSVHAEQLALINASMTNGADIIIYGYDCVAGEEIEALPCKICARMILAAGIKHVITNKGVYSAPDLCWSIIQA